MNTEKLYHYTYIITNVVENKYYIGCRSSNVCPSKDLGIYYFSSSKDKDFIKDQKQNPQNYIYKIIATFTERRLCLALEIKLHAIHDVGVNPKFYNRVKQTNTKFDITGNKEIAAKISKKASGNKRKPHSEETKLKISAANKGKPSKLKGIPKPEEQREKISKSRIGAKHPLAKFANVYNYTTKELIAENVVLREWCRINKIEYTSLCKTATGKAKKAKNYYAVYIN